MDINKERADAVRARDAVLRVMQESDRETREGLEITLANIEKKICELKQPQEKLK